MKVPATALMVAILGAVAAAAAAAEAAAAEAEAAAATVKSGNFGHAENCL